MRYRYFDDFGRDISVFAIFSYGIAVLGTAQCPPLWSMFADLNSRLSPKLPDKDVLIFFLERKEFAKNDLHSP